MGDIEHWDVYACEGECPQRSGLWNVAPKDMTCPECGNRVVPVRVYANPSGAVGRADRLHEEFTIFVDACGHCLAGGRPPNQAMIDAARITLAANRGR